MSRKVVKSDNRCPVCGGRMRLVNVTWVNRFSAPEASQYDLSVSRRNALLKKAPKTSSQEMMCFSCSRRLPLDKDALKKAKKAAKKAEKQSKKAEKQSQKANNQDNSNNNTANNNNSKKSNKTRVGSIIRSIIFLVLLAVTAYFVYTYRNILLGYVDKAVELFNKAKEFVESFL